MQTTTATPPGIDYSELQDGDALRVPLSLIDPAPWGNIRKRRNPEAFANLRAGIRTAKGVTQGVTVRANPENPYRLQLLAGYGRVKAAGLEGFLDVPATIKVVDDKEAMAIMMSENLDREKLSIADEITAAQRYVSYYDGDYASAADALNWSVTRLRGRLALNQCSEAVLEALRDEHILLGHAEILSAFTHKLQDGTLAKIIAENWSVEYLKERAGKANRLLKNAIFNTDDCQGCSHNSDLQAELFSNTVGRARCSNLVCFKDKTDASLAVRKAELEEEYGVVLLAIEKPASDRNTVSSDAVGETQYSTGCIGCTSRVAIIQDGINADAGQVQTDQCIDTTCFRKMRNAANPVPKATSKGRAKADKPASKSASPKNATPAGKTPATQKTPGTVIERNKDILRGISADFFAGNHHFMDAVATATLIHDAMQVKVADAISATGVKLDTDFNNKVMELYALTPEKLAEVKKACFLGWMKTGGDLLRQRSLMLTALANDPSGKAVAQSRWAPTKEILAGYLKGGLIAIANKSGFAADYDKTHGEEAFKKVASGKKNALVDVMLNHTFDWSAYAPDDYMTQLK